MAVRFALSSAERRIGFVFLRPITTTTDIRRGAVGNAVASVTVRDSHGKLKTVADLPEINTFRMLYTLIFKGYLNRVHELQVKQENSLTVTAGLFKRFLPSFMYSDCQCFAF